MMRFFAALVCLVSVASAIDPDLIEQFKETMKRNVETCATQVNASPDDVSSIFSHKIPETHEGKCIFFCIHKMFHIQKENGKFDKASTMTMIDILRDMDADLHEKVSEMMRRCISSVEVDKDPCIFAANLAECAGRESVNLGMEEAVFE